MKITEIHMDEVLALAQESYRILLQLPVNSPLRVRNQAHLAKLRDFIAKQTGTDPQLVQEHYEHEWMPLSSQFCCCADRFAV
jgi:hypothetical protein